MLKLLVIKIPCVQFFIHKNVYNFLIERFMVNYLNQRQRAKSDFIASGVIT